MTFRSRRLSFALAGLVALPLSGCELVDALLSQEFVVPVDLATPPADINVTEQVDAVEAGLCSEADSYNCAVVRALDYSDDEQVANPPRIPAEFPVAVDITNPDTGETENVNVEDWAADVGLAQELDFKQHFPMDLTALIDVDDPAAIEDVRVADVALDWIENTFTFDSVPMDLYVGTEFVDDPLADAQQLIDDGVVEKVGTIPAQEAGVAEPTPVEFIDGGNETFNTAIKGLKFTVVLAFPPGTPISLKEGSDENLRQKPTGEAQISLTAKIEYTVSAEKLREGAESIAE